MDEDGDAGNHGPGGRPTEGIACIASGGCRSCGVIEAEQSKTLSVANC